MQVDLVHAETLFQRPHLGVFNRAAGPSCALRNAANLFAVLLLFTGCKHDLRISVDQLAEAEQVVETQPDRAAAARGRGAAGGGAKRGEHDRRG